jgi:hypothetical protein
MRPWRTRDASFEPPRRRCAAVVKCAVAEEPNPSHPERPMKHLMSILTLAVAAFSAPAFAANAECEAAAKEKKLAGAALTSFMKKCEADAGGSSDCEAMAAQKKLAGAAKTSFVTKCEKDGGKTASATAACDKQADDKKLFGAARTSFTKKCVSDAGG